MLPKVLVPEEVKRQRRSLVITKTVWWRRSVAVFVHDFQVLTLVHQTLAQLRSVEGQLSLVRNVAISDIVILKVCGNWYRARVERVYGKFASLTLIDVGHFLEKVSVGRLRDVRNLCKTIAYSPEAQAFFLDRLHPRLFEIPDPEVLSRATQEGCINKNVWFEGGCDVGSEQTVGKAPDWPFPMIHDLHNTHGECFADRLGPLLESSPVARNTPSRLAEAALHPTEVVSVVRNEGSRLGVQLTRFPTEELSRLECELTVLGEQALLEAADALQEDDPVAVLWNEKFVRGRAAQFGTSTADVYLVDYGISATRANSSLWKLPTELAERLPPFGLRVQVRNSAPEISHEDHLLVLSSIKIDEATGIASADVSSIEVNAGGKNRLPDGELPDDELKESETSSKETVARGDTAAPWVGTAPIESSTSHNTVEPCSFEVDQRLSECDESSVDQSMSLPAQSYLSPKEGEDEPALRENGTVKHGNEFGSVPNPCDVPSDPDAIETPAHDVCGASEGTWRQRNGTPVDDVPPDSAMEVDGGAHRFRKSFELPASGNRDLVPEWPGETEKTKDERSSIEITTKAHQDGILRQSKPAGIELTSSRTSSLPLRNDARSHPAGPRSGRQSLTSRVPTVDSQPVDDLNSGNFQRRVVTPPKHRYLGSGRLPRDLASDAVREYSGNESIHAPIERHTSSNQNPESELEHREFPVFANGNCVKRTETGSEVRDSREEVPTQSFLVECVLEEKEGLFLGAHCTRGRNIQEILSSLRVDSLEEIPLRRLKIDQLVLFEHLRGLVRGRVVEITRHKIELRLEDQNGACTATRVYSCPDALADITTTLQKIQLKPPRPDLRYGDQVRVIQGEHIDEDRLLVSRHEFHAKGNQIN